MIERGMCVDPTNGSGKLKNPEKGYLLRLTTSAVRDVNQQKEKDGVLYASKAIICCSMALNLNRQWEERQLFPLLLEIIKKYREKCEGARVDMEQDLEGETIETERH